MNFLFLFSEEIISYFYCFICNPLFLLLLFLRHDISFFLSFWTNRKIPLKIYTSLRFLYRKRKTTKSWRIVFWVGHFPEIERDEYFTFIPLLFESDFLVCEECDGYAISYKSSEWIWSGPRVVDFFRRSEIVQSLTLW